MFLVTYGWMQLYEQPEKGRNGAVRKGSIPYFEMPNEEMEIACNIYYTQFIFINLQFKYLFQADISIAFVKFCAGNKEKISLYYLAI